MLADNYFVQGNGGLGKLIRDGVLHNGSNFKKITGYIVSRRGSYSPNVGGYYALMPDVSDPTNFDGYMQADFATDDPNSLLDVIDGLGAGAIVGIAVGALVAVLLLGVLGYCCKTRHLGKGDSKVQQKKKPAEDDGVELPTKQDKKDAKAKAKQEKKEAAAKAKQEKKEAKEAAKKEKTDKKNAKKEEKKSKKGKKGKKGEETEGGEGADDQV